LTLIVAIVRLSALSTNYRAPRALSFVVEPMLFLFNLVSVSYWLFFRPHLDAESEIIFKMAVAFAMQGIALMFSEVLFLPEKFYPKQAWTSYFNSHIIQHLANLIGFYVIVWATYDYMLIRQKQETY